MGVVNEKVINVCCTWRKETTDSEPFQGNFNAESDKFLLPIEKDEKIKAQILKSFGFISKSALNFFNNSSAFII